MTTKTHTHCQCDFCTGEDCGQDNPDKLRAEREADEKEHDETIRLREHEKCITLAKEQMNLERVEVLDYIYSFCNIQNCTRDCGCCKLSKLIGLLEERKLQGAR
jgi:hypothetical protein